MKPTETNTDYRDRVRHHRVHQAQNEMNDLTLNILQPGELVIPDLMAKSNLTLAEIGIIYLFFASKADILEDPRLTSKAGKAACESLKKRGVLKVELVKIADKNSRLKIQLDLDKVKVTP